MAFLYGWKCFLVMDPGISAALATGFATYVSVIVPLGPVAVRSIGIGAIVVLALVHIAGVRPGTRLLTTMTVLTLALILALIVLAFANRSGDWDHFLPFASRRPAAPPLGPALAGAFIAAFFSFGGWREEARTGEVKDPARTVLRAAVGAADRDRRYVVVNMTARSVGRPGPTRQDV